MGWREWVSLPQLGIPAIKAKVDTGARTSALHTFAIDVFRDKGVQRVRFGIHPIRRKPEIELFCEADVTDVRTISDSGGHKERRHIITTDVKIGDHVWPIEISLTNRETMIFRMLLGRTGIAERLVVDPAMSYVTGRALSKSYALDRG